MIRCLVLLSYLSFFKVENVIFNNLRRVNAISSYNFFYQLRLVIMKCSALSSSLQQKYIHKTKLYTSTPLIIVENHQCIIIINQSKRSIGFFFFEKKAFDLLEFVRYIVHLSSIFSDIEFVFVPREANISADLID